eukprot:gene25230-10876_t
MNGVSVPALLWLNRPLPPSSSNYAVTITSSARSSVDRGDRRSTLPGLWRDVKEVAFTPAGFDFVYLAGSHVSDFVYLAAGFDFVYLAGSHAAVASTVAGPSSTVLAGAGSTVVIRPGAKIIDAGALSAQQTRERLERLRADLADR